MKKTFFEGSKKGLSAVGLGCSRIGSFNNPLSLSEVRSLLAASFDAGVTVFDTSDVYGQGDSERELGRFLAGRRKTEAFVVTKGGKLFSSKMRLLRPFKPLLKPLLSRSGRGAVTARRSDEISEDFSSAHIVEAVEGSLRRLRTETLDGYILHSPPVSAVGQHLLWETLAQLKTAGKIASFGVSCDTKEVLEASMAMPGATLLELPFDVLKDIENSDIALEISRRHMIVLAREVIRFQPGVVPDQAVRNAFLMPIVSTIVLGTTKIQNLRSAIAAVES